MVLAQCAMLCRKLQLKSLALMPGLHGGAQGRADADGAGSAARPEATGAARRVALMERRILTIYHHITWSCPGPMGSQLCRKLQLEAQALTRGYVEAHGRVLTRAVLASSDGQEWRAAREPRAPRPLCAELLQALAGAREEALQLIDSSVLQGTLSGEGAACLCDPRTPAPFAILLAPV